MPAVPSTWLSWGQSAQDESLVRPGPQGPPAAVSPTAAVTRLGDSGAQRSPQRRPPHLSTLPGPRGRRALPTVGAISPLFYFKTQGKCDKNPVLRLISK